MPRVFVVLDIDGGPDSTRYADERDWLSEISTWVEAVDRRFVGATVYASVEDLELDRIERLGAFDHAAMDDAAPGFDVVPDQLPLFAL